jgi:radical SAM superfamily enzyme YgiQ (UPF0313 family)
MSHSVDVLFINPGDRRQIYQTLGDEFCAIEPPVFAGLFATHVRRAGFSAAIYDAPAMGSSAEETARTVVEDFRPKLVVIVVYGFQPSASTQNMSVAGKVARLIKEAAPCLPIMMTGTHPAALPERTMRDEVIDFLCDLEGPVTITRTIRAIDAGSTDFGAIPSLWWRDDGHVVRPRSTEPLIRDLDAELPGIAWDLLPMERYRAHNWHCFGDIDARSPYAAIHTSLGCPYRCSFCCINAPFGKSSYRMWSPEQVVAEIDLLVTRYGVRNIKIVDEMFVLNRHHVTRLCNLLWNRGYALNIWAYARVDTVEEGDLLAMRRAGINWICLGIESASENVRDGAQKSYGNEEIVQVVRGIQSAGIRVLGNYIFGLPDDTRNSMQQTLDLALELNCEFANFYSAMAYPGSKLYDQAVLNGALLPKEWHHYSQHSFDTTPLANGNLTATEILKFRDHAWNTYFTHPGYLKMIGEKFGRPIVDHIGRMVATPLPRRYRTPQVA